MSSPPSSSTDLVEELIARVLCAVDEAREAEIEAIRIEFPELIDEVLEALAKLERFEQGSPGLEFEFDSEDAEEAFPTQNPAARYVRINLHAEGGMGEIWRCQDRQLGRVVAMKVLHPRGTRIPQDSLTSALTLKDLRRFYEEARIMGQLDHPGVPAVHDVGRDEEGRPYITMPLVRGETLVQVFEKYHALVDGWNLRRCLDILVKVCDTLAHAHSRGVIHRDLKPSNIMVGQFGEVYVMDWGIAKVLDESTLEPSSDTGEFFLGDVEPEVRRQRLETVQGVVVGTPNYMAPEQALQKRDDIGVATDVYAVGALLYEILVGMAPYRHANPELTNKEVLQAVRTGPPEPAFELAPDAPEELLAICAKAMAREIDQRYETMKDLRDDLRNFLDGYVVVAHGGGLAAHVSKWFQRNATIGFTIAIGLIYALVALFMFVRRTAEDRELLIRERERSQRALTLLQYSRMTANVERLQTLVERDFRPLTLRRLDAMELWLDEARGLATLYEQLRDDLDRLRIDSSPMSTDPANASSNFGGQLGFGDETREEEYELLEILRNEVREFFEGPEDGMLGNTLYEVTRAVHALHRVQRLQEQTPAELPTWEQARAAIEASPLYGHLVLEPQPHLVPLGENPRTGLWEFADVLSGELPHREEERWVVGDRAGLIFVLVPGGIADIGYRSSEEQALGPRPDEVPANEISLEPFFLSKYELTREQWTQLTGIVLPQGETEANDGVRYALPALGLEWSLTDDVLRATGMTFPTEAQWEYACRAGDPRTWSHGPLDVDLGQSSTHDKQRPSPVGSWPANAFGFCDMHGNAMEWCRDVYTDYTVPARPGDGLRDPGDETLPRVLRGGSYAQGTDASRSTARHQASRHAALPTFGARPARALH